MLARFSDSTWFPRRGEVTEVVGRLSSGRTSLVVAWLADATARGGVVAVVDADDTFDPTSAARAGVDLRRLLWVRCGGRRDAALRATDLLVRCPGFAVIVLDTGEVPPRVTLTAAFRLRLAARRAETALVILARRRVAGAGATLAIETAVDGLDWSGPGRRPTRLAGLRTVLQVVRPHAAGHPRMLRQVEERPGLAGALRASGSVRSHCGAPHVINWGV